MNWKMFKFNNETLIFLKFYCIKSKNNFKFWDNDDVLSLIAGEVYFLVEFNSK